jgi:predicted GNAT family acetyltransferase
MNASDQSMTVIDNGGAHRFEALVDGDVAGFLTYREARGALVLLHTEVVPAYEGKGVGGQLARGALQLIRQRGQKIRILCPFVSQFVQRHPEYDDLVAN